MRALIDTCVMIDSLQKREPFRESADEIILIVAKKECEGVITAKSSTDIYYFMHKAFHSDVEARKVLTKIFSLFNVVDTAGIDCENALISEIQDYEDGVMIETAIREKCDCIVTRNIKDYKTSKIKVFEPNDFVNYLKIS